MREFTIALKIVVLLLLLGFAWWLLRGHATVTVQCHPGIGDDHATVESHGGAVEAVPEDPPEIERPLEGVCTGVVASGAVNVTIFDSPRSKLKIWNSVKAGDLAIPRIVDGTLLIQGGAMDLDPEDVPSISVFCRGVARVVHRGKGDVTAHHLTGSHLSAITSGEANLAIGGEGDDCHLATTGSGAISTSWLRVPRLEIAMSGSGDVEPDGEWSRLEVQQDGTGNLIVDSIRPADVVIHLTGDGSADVGLVRSLDATIQGDGTITANGSPEHVRRNIVGNGTVEVRP